MEQQITVLVADPVAEERRRTERAFESAGFHIRTAETEREVSASIQLFNPDIIVLSDQFPSWSGMDYCRDLRFGGDWTPVIMLTEETSEVDRVLRFEIGADDIVTRPIRTKELTARIKSILRRNALCCPPDEAAGPHLLVNGPLVVDSEQFTARLHGEWLEFTRREFEIVVFFMRNRDRSFSRQEIIDAASEEEASMDERIVDVFISRIRQKIEQNKRNPQFIKTVRGIGYRMCSLEGSQVHRPVT
ncbi:response regulator transcription factor [Alkalicoccus urumqiensis]|uniref:DNA-binding response regulator n=1 Tax=Alkalicoccus urumqiensis TaxID=1548213 RepID=A0A2P6MF50_ALKUR|nr:response regulator transcription factor [Alkalicoccus urumqiensis]PRO64877.1 DNA-binding response regulator [Alkalicoccus urumqiensis]